MKVICDFRTLMQYAFEMGRAEKSGDKEAFAKAKARHDEYRDLCLKADGMQLGMTVGELSRPYGDRHK